ncbi:MAG: DUF192 domain-containing protein [Pseudomonadota bacterium]|nr:DUF192 domain-containing protein [Pseudomonadota bacterium]
MNRRTLLATLALVPAAALAQLHEAAGPQPELPKEALTIVTQDHRRHDFQVEIARAPQQQMIGEMFRKEVPADGGMLFVWPAPQLSPMWMKNTLVPLDMLFINANGTIRHIAEDTVPRSQRLIESGGPVAATLELRGGTAARLGITVGDKVLGAMFHDLG